MVGIAALVSLLLLFAYPPVAPLAIVSTVNLFLWRQRRAMLRADHALLRADQARARARAEERRRRELILAMKSLP